MNKKPKTVIIVSLNYIFFLFLIHPLYVHLALAFYKHFFMNDLWKNFFKKSSQEYISLL